MIKYMGNPNKYSKPNITTPLLYYTALPHVMVLRVSANRYCTIDCSQQGSRKKVETARYYT